jgi:hypothetical protein
MLRKCWHSSKAIGKMRSEQHFSRTQRAFVHQKKGTFENLGAFPLPPVSTPLNNEMINLIKLHYLLFEHCIRRDRNSTYETDLKLFSIGFYLGKNLKARGEILISV